MKGICVDLGSSVNLKIDEEYFLFTYGPNHYNASRFNNQGAHFGIIQELNGEWEQLALF